MSGLLPDIRRYVTWPRVISLVIMVVCLAAIGWGMIIRLGTSTLDLPTTKTLVGTIVCLPHADQGQVQTMECAYGLQASDGFYYGLAGLDQTDLINGYLTVGKQVLVKGALRANQADQRYAIKATIEVVTMTRVSN